MNTKITEQYIRISNKLEISFSEAVIFRRKAMTLHRWFERECGDSNMYMSWAIERDEKTEKPYLVRYYNNGKTYRTAIPDLEKGARKAIERRCKELGLFFYIQTDPRGLALYLSREELTSENYNRKGFGVGF